MKLLNVFISSLGVFMSVELYAASNIYQCQVLSDAFIRSDGVMELVKDSPRLEQKFTVIKKTGEIIGDVMDPLKNPKVLSQGSEKNAYKIIWQQKAAGKNGVFIDYLSIDESARGSKKPFGFFSGTMVISGICE
jgi:hypothetical protein